MLSKKRTSSFYWKNKLEKLDNLPGGELLDKNMLWERLNGRLQEKPQKIKAVWYWVAAAVLPLTIITLMLEDRTEDVLVREVPVKTVIIRAPATPIHSLENKTVAVSTPVVIEKKQPVNISHKANRVENSDNIVIESKAVIAISPVAESTDFSFTDNASKAYDTVAATTTALTKKLSVVHINELETFPLQFSTPVNYAKNLDKIKPGKNKTNSQAFVTKQNGFGFRINLSSKN